MKKFFNSLFGTKSSKHIPGSFLGDEEPYPSTMTLEQQERFGLDEKLIEFEVDELSTILPSENLMDAFERMQAMTFPKVHALNDKRTSVIELRKSGLLQNIPQGEMVYIGSGYDIEYPLLFGGRNIVLVDPLFQSPVAIHELVHRIEEIIEAKVIQKDQCTINFAFAFEHAFYESVTVKVIPKYADIGAHQDLDVFVPEGAISFLLGFASGGYLDEDKKLLEAVTTNGFVYGPVTSQEVMINHHFSIIELPSMQHLYIKR